MQPLTFIIPILISQDRLIQIEDWGLTNTDSGPGLVNTNLGAGVSIYKSGPGLPKSQCFNGAHKRSAF